ncbi:MAG: 2-C-methyl-D-erythritol 2,4-cyclodiphosphate synthase [Dehalococcoidia bacterium]|nr:2-C-methyl-D-erythritol 2,4-cyclodiphosphate synthase [Dehalococcoidia bacterium]
MGTNSCRVGIGYDVHRLGPGRSLVLGGVHVPFDSGLVGHSDGDVLVHAIMDALLGAAGLKDIGYYFPNIDVQYKNISSLLLLERVRKLIEEKGREIVNVDSSIVAESPKLSPFIDKMKENIGKTLGIDIDSVGIKVTTNEGLGFVGRGEGMMAWAVVMVEKK